MMIRVYHNRLEGVVLLVAVGGVMIAPGLATAQPAGPTGPKAMIVSPAPEPVPALKYRLLPSSAELNPGDAAPIYLRIHGYEDTALEEHWRQVTEKSKRWLPLPLKDFPTAEVRAFVDRWSGKFEQLEFGTRRTTCDWSYTVPEEWDHVRDILLPDIQSMREWGRLLALRARVEIAEGKTEQAVRTIETGLAFGRHVGGGPFLINGLVGIAIAYTMLDCCEDLIVRPGAPNLYWALTALPRPLVGLRNQIELERQFFENQIPELRETELARPRTAAEWSALLARLHEGIVRWARFNAQRGGQDPGLREAAERELPRFKSGELPAAKVHLKAVRKLTDEQLTAMSEDQIVALHIADGYRAIWDDWFKAGYLPAHEAIAQHATALKRLAAAKEGPFIPFVDFVAGVYPALKGELRLDRRVAVLRAIEAVRLYAALHGGALPESLGQITEVPVPEDPATGQPFKYHRNGNSAILSGPLADLPAVAQPSYRITIRH
jgi:hypothetical protein